MANAVRDDNRVTGLLGVSSVDLQTPTRWRINPVTGAAYIDSASLYAGLDTRYLKLNNGSAYNAYIFPSADGSVDQVLTTDGSGNLSWETVAGGSGSPGGSNTQVQFNDSSAFGGDAGFTYNKTTDTATLANLVLTNDLPVTEGGTGASTAADARTNLGLVAGGTGDIWVEKAGDTMTGNLVIGDDHFLNVDGSVIFNETGAAVDFRVESDGNANMLFVDGADNRVGIGTNAPAEMLHLVNTGFTTMRFDADSDSGYFYADGTFHFVVMGSRTATPVLFQYNATERLSFLSASNVFNDIGADIDLRMEGDTNVNLFYLDASADKIGFGTSTPAERLNVIGNFQVDDATTSTKGYRFRTSGFSLDLDAAAANLLLSTYTGAGFTGTQRQYIEFGAEFEFEKHYKKTIWDSSGDMFVIDKDAADGFVWNETGADKNARFEGDTDASLLFLDAGLDMVGVATNTPASRLHVGGSFGTAIVSKTTTYTADATDYTILCSASGAAFTVTLPAAAGCSGRIYVIKKTDASGNAVTVDGNASETIDGATTYSLATQYKYVMIQSNGTNWFIIANN